MQISDPKHSLKGQVGVIALTAALLLGIVVLKNGFSFHFAKGDQKSEVKYTYEGVKQQVTQELAAEPANAEDKTNEQLAALDPNYQSSDVLGANTSTDNSIPPAENIFTPELLNSIQVSVLPDTTSENVKKYAEQVLYVESSNNTDALLMALNSDDPSALQDVPVAAQKVTAELKGLSVPKELELYHKLKLIYYMNLSNIAQDLSGESQGKEFGINENTTILFSVLEKLDSIRAEILTKYQVDL